MIVVKLMGGLGNQMFQYAAGRALAIKHNVPLYVDESFLKADPNGAYTQRKPELAQLKTKLRTAGSSELATFDGRNFFDLLLMREKSVKNVLAEGDGFNTEFFNVQPPVYLDGFWQSEAYFKAIRDVLLEEFSPVGESGTKAQEYLSLIKQAHSVSIHVRRGDYISNAAAAGFHGFPGLGYYRKATELIQTQVKDCVFFVFSDDLAWCRENLNWPGKFVFVDTKSELAATDLCLMKSCRHNIIANSSYSWWGAWLNQHPDKKVIAPRNWFATSRSSDHIYGYNWSVI